MVTTTSSQQNVCVTVFGLAYYHLILTEYIVLSVFLQHTLLLPMLETNVFYLHAEVRVFCCPLFADVNECNELNNRMSLCKNAKCINTEGSYKCLCLPGYVPSDKPNYCTPLNSELDSELE